MQVNGHRLAVDPRGAVIDLEVRAGRSVSASAES